jgi:hypothetical protein
MLTVLQPLRQRGMVTGYNPGPVPADVDIYAPTADETRATEAFEVRRISAFMEISFRMADSAKTVLGNTEDPRSVGSCWRSIMVQSSKGCTPFSWRNYS